MVTNSTCESTAFASLVEKSRDLVSGTLLKTFQETVYSFFSNIVDNSNENGNGNEKQSLVCDLNTLQAFISLQLQVIDSLKPALQQMRNAVDTVFAADGDTLLLSPQWECLRQSILQTDGLYNMDCPVVVLNTTKRMNTKMRARSHRLLEKQEQGASMMIGTEALPSTQSACPPNHLLLGKKGTEMKTQTFETENGTVVTVKTIPPTKRGRGRPRKVRVENTVTTDDANVLPSSGKRLRSQSSTAQMDGNQVVQEDAQTAPQSSGEQPAQTTDQSHSQPTPNRSACDQSPNLHQLREAERTLIGTSADNLVPVKRGRGRPRKHPVVNSMGNNLFCQ